MSLTEARHEFKILVLALDRGCIAEADSPCEGDVQAHHVITQQQLRSEDLEDLLWDPANGAAVCERHHRRHHNRRESIFRDRLPARCVKFAVEFDLDQYLDRYYA